MGIQRSEALGRNLRFMAATQSAIGTRPTLAATDSFIARSYSVVPSEERIKRRTPQSSRSLRERYVGNRAVDVTIVCEHLPQGAATPPDYAVLLAAGFGAQAIGGSAVTYSHSNTQTLPMVWLEVDCGLNTATTAEYKEAVDGLVIEQIKLSVSKDEIPLIEFSGPGHSMVQTGRSVSENTADLRPRSAWRPARIADDSASTASSPSAPAPTLAQGTWSLRSTIPRASSPSPPL